MPEILSKVIRGETIESIHRGHLIVVDGDFNTVYQIGEPETITFWRSAAKAFQTIPFLTSGAASTFGFAEEEIALACASHAGEVFHTKLVQKMLERSSSKESGLLCGPHPPFHKKTAEQMIRDGEQPSQLHNNCSGKHAAMIAFAKHAGHDVRDYLSLKNFIQKAIFETVSLFTDIPVSEIKIGVDGCSAPTFAIPISAMARGFAKLINPPENFDDVLKKACSQIVSAKIRHPELIGGSTQLDTQIMQAFRGRVICKVGAEGVWSAGILPCEKWENGLAVALKIEGGNNESSRSAIAVELLRQLKVMDENAEKILGKFSPRILRNWKDIEVGKIVTDFKLV